MITTCNDLGFFGPAEMQKPRENYTWALSILDEDGNMLWTYCSDRNWQAVLGFSRAHLGVNYGDKIAQRAYIFGDPKKAISTVRRKFKPNPDGWESGLHYVVID